MNIFLFLFFNFLFLYCALSPQCFGLLYTLWMQRQKKVIKKDKTIFFSFNAIPIKLKHLKTLIHTVITLNPE